MLVKGFVVGFSALYLFFSDVSLAEERILFKNLIDNISEEYFYSIFEELVLQSEYGISNGLVHKWERNVYVNVVSESESMINFSESRIDVISEFIEEVTDLNINITNNDEITNSWIIFSSTDVMMAAFERVGGIGGEHIPCFVATGKNNDHEIFKSVMYISYENDQDEINSCLTKEFSQSFGIFNDSSSIENTIFRNSNNRQTLTNLDWFILYALYRPEVDPGMDISQVKSALQPYWQ